MWNAQNGQTIEMRSASVVARGWEEGREQSVAGTGFSFGVIKKKYAIIRVTKVS